MLLSVVGLSCAVLLLGACGSSANRTVTAASPTSSTEALLAAAHAAEPAVSKIDVRTCDDRGSGSGFFIDGSHLVTAAHVVDSALTIDVGLGSRTVAAEVIGYNARADVAMLQLVGTTYDGTPLTLSEEDPKVGAPIAAIGYPGGESLTSTRGTVTDVNQSVEVQDGVRRGRLVKTDALVSPGNSGGPLVGTDGKVYGVVHAGGIYDTEYGWAVSPVVASDFVRAWQAQPQSYAAPSCGSSDPGWDDSGPTEAPQPSSGGGAAPVSWPAYEYVGPSAYDVCQTSTYPLSRGLSTATSSPAGTPQDWSVQSLQAGLRALNYGSPKPVVVDGDFGPQTARAVRSFQARKGLVVDGLVGQQTWGALYDALHAYTDICP